MKGVRFWSQRLVIIREPSGRQFETVVHVTTHTVRVPVAPEPRIIIRRTIRAGERQQFGHVDFVHQGRSTVSGLPVFESSSNILAASSDSRVALWGER